MITHSLFNVGKLVDGRVVSALLSSFLCVRSDVTNFVGT